MRAPWYIIKCVENFDPLQFITHTHIQTLNWVALVSARQQKR